jgi:hypothetical protein
VYLKRNQKQKTAFAQSGLLLFRSNSYLESGTRPPLIDDVQHVIHANESIVIGICRAVAWAILGLAECPDAAEVAAEQLACRAVDDGADAVGATRAVLTRTVEDVASQIIPGSFNRVL